MLTADQLALVAIRRLQEAPSRGTLLLVIEDILRQFTGNRGSVPAGSTPIPVVGRDGHVGVLRVESPRDVVLSKFPTSPAGAGNHYTLRHWRRYYAFVYDQASVTVNQDTWSTESVEASRVDYWQEMKDERLAPGETHTWGTK